MGGHPVDEIPRLVGGGYNPVEEGNQRDSISTGEHHLFNYFGYLGWGDRVG